MTTKCKPISYTLSLIAYQLSTIWECESEHRFTLACHLAEKKSLPAKLNSRVFNLPGGLVSSARWRPSVKRFSDYGPNLDTFFQNFFSLQRFDRQLNVINEKMYKYLDELRSIEANVDESKLQKMKGLRETEQKFNALLARA